MSSLRAQILAVVATKLEAVRDALDWATLLANPREPVGEDQVNAIVFIHGGDREPVTLTGGVEIREMDFSVAWLIQETASDSAETLLDDGYVAISDALLDPGDMQLSGLAIGILQGAISEPTIGRSANGGRILGGQSVDFTVQYLAREGDASTPAP